MSRKERVRQTLRHIQTDIVPYSIELTIPAHEKMARYYNDPGFLEKTGRHTVYALRKNPEEKKFPVKKGFYRDEFGVIWDRRVDRDIGIVAHYPVDESNVQTYPFPDPRDDRYYEHLPEFFKKHNDYFIEGAIGFSFFERAWTLAGMEKILVSFADNPGFVETLFDRLTEWLILAARKFGQYEEIDSIHFGDDWGQQHGLIMGPVYWRRYIKPRLAKVYAEVKKHGKFVSIHSCGDIKEILPDLIEIGLDMFNPFQPEVMDVYEMKRLYGDKLTFFGGISLQKTLAFGTPRDVESEVLDRIARIGKNGGYIASPCHAITKDVPEENIHALIRTLRSQKKSLERNH